MLKDKLLYERSRSCRYLSFVSLSKSTMPLRLFDEISRSIRLAKLEIDFGIKPYSLLFPTQRICSELLRWNSPIWPVSWLLDKSTSMSFVKLIKKLGILPSKLLLLRTMELRSLRNESDDGIWPMKLLDLRKILETFMRFPSDVGINPTKLKFYEIKRFPRNLRYQLKMMMGFYQWAGWIVEPSKRAPRVLKVMTVSHHWYHYW